MAFVNSVFLSSTILDLKEERQAAIDVFVNLGIMPYSMEFFLRMDRKNRKLLQS